MIKDLPPTNSTMFLDRVREAIQSLAGKGDPSDRAVTVHDLDTAGIASPGPRGGLTDPEPDMTPPPPPTGFSATAGTTRIQFLVDQPRYTVGHGHARTIVYAANWDGVSALPTFSDAVEFFNFPGPIDSAPFDPASNLRLWARNKSVDGALSTPAGGTNGISVTMGLIDDLMVASINVSKLLAGSLAVGQYIQSADYLANTDGWRIQTDAGGAAFMEVNGGAIIGGAIIGATYVRSTNYTLGVQGWGLNSDGTGQIGGLEVASDYIQSTNYVAATSGFRLTYDGQFLSKGVNIDAAGNATFSGALSAATGSFAGSLSAATGTFAGSLSAATGTFAGSLSAATGTFSGNLSAAGGTFSGTLSAVAVDTANIVGAAISTNASSTGVSTCSVSITAPAGSSTLVILADPSSLFDTPSGMWSLNRGTLTINGTDVITTKPGFIQYTINNPSGSYTIDLSSIQAASSSASGVTVSLSALLTKR